MNARPPAIIRVAPFVIALTLLGLVGSVGPAVRSLKRGTTDPLQEQYANYMARFAGLRAHLSASGGAVGYLQERAAAEFLPANEAYLDVFFARFALAPTIPMADTRAPALLIVNFADPERPAALVRAEALETVIDLGNGVALLRRP